LAKARACVILIAFSGQQSAFSPTIFRPQYTSSLQPGDRYSEHHYLQASIEDIFGQRLSLEALVTANAGQRDFELLLASEIPVPIFEPLLAEVQQAELLLERLRSLGRVMR
jgi:hypothetical protein